MALTGGCRRGAVRYDLAMPALPLAYACHCRDCQTVSGAAFTMQAPVAQDRLVFDGETVKRIAPLNGGGESTHLFCAQCLTRLTSMPSVAPGRSLLRAGTLDRSDEMTPAMHMWVQRKQAWLALPADAETHDANAPMDRINALVAPNLA